MKRRLLQILQIALTCGVLYWLFHDPAKRDAMMAALLKADWRWLALGTLVGFLGEIAGIWRWGLFLRMQGIRESWQTIARWFFVGLFFNMFLPGTTGGDLAKLYYLCRDHPDKRRAGLLTLLMDRLCGLIPLILFAALGTALNYRWLTSTPATAGLLWSVLIFCGGMSVVIGGSFLFSGARLGEKLPHWLPGRDGIIRMSDTWHLFATDGKRLLATLLLSLPVLFSYYGGFYCASRAFGAGVSLVHIFSIMPIVTVISSLPLSVGGLGVREGLFERLLGDLCGTSPEVASVISLTGYAIFLSFGLLGALVYAFAPPIDRRTLAEMQKAG